jgi:hypothetical protein
MTRFLWSLPVGVAFAYFMSQEQYAAAVLVFPVNLLGYVQGLAADRPE